MQAPRHSWLLTPVDKALVAKDDHDHSVKAPKCLIKTTPKKLNLKHRYQ